ncbi:hypothetical protein AAJ76_9300010202 [Vairimorpha ceranae]|uniref:Uncharacterized protein n=1 Tax=Vairimorpha ceranae TaxID=40302 RepID=A0A0F9W998_9MICR|nr:hypothetical protein AAJ76_9300010202 [Vairimorpha ceranae]KKO74256.1 hypothetical protein AAJ76_9300010202 [Vairimorpha ceranae]
MDNKINKKPSQRLSRNFSNKHNLSLKFSKPYKLLFVFAKIDIIIL